MVESVKLEVIPKNRIVSLDPVIDAFKEFKCGIFNSCSPFKISDKQVQRNHNTNDFIADLNYEYFSDATVYNTEHYMLSGITQQKYIDLWPQELEDIFTDIDNWRIRRFSPYIDLFEFLNEDGSSSVSIKSELMKDVGAYPLSNNNVIYGIPNKISVSSKSIITAIVSSEVGLSLAKLTNKLMFPCYIHATALNPTITPWIFQGYRMLVSFNDAKNEVSIKSLPSDNNQANQ